MKNIILQMGAEALVDDEDFDRLNADTYSHAYEGEHEVVVRERDGVPMANIVMSVHPKENVKHIDGNPLNVQKENLETKSVRDERKAADKAEKAEAKALSKAEKARAKAEADEERRAVELAEAELAEREALEREEAEVQEWLKAERDAETAERVAAATAENEEAENKEKE